MRGLLVVNPTATATSARARDVVAGALRSEMELKVRYTRGRGHGFDLAYEAAAKGLDVVVTLGGDGTINEVVNGLMSGTDKERPALAVVPGGSANVFVRALGLPKLPIEATGAILSALRKETSRTISLGLAEDRYFTFCAGIGIDAAVARRVEKARQRGRRSTPMLYLLSTFGEYFSETTRSLPELTLSLPGDPHEYGVANVIVQNTAPWTYLGDRAVHASVQASFDSGLDVVAFRELELGRTLHTVAQMMTARSDLYGEQVLLRHDLAEFTVNSKAPEAFQLDGDYLGEREKVKFTSVSNALRVIC